MSMVKTCPACGLAFVTREALKVFCSKRCWQRAYQGREKEIRVCPVCGASFETYRKNQIYCSKVCSRAHQKGMDKLRTPEKRLKRLKEQDEMRQHDAQESWSGDYPDLSLDDTIYGNMVAL